MRSGKALAKVIEYSGEAIEALSVDERATMTNMAAEIGGFTGIVAPGREGRRIPGDAARHEPRNEAQTLVEGLYSDPDAHYAHVIELDATEIYPMVATPGDPGNGKFIRELNTRLPVEIAYGGTCTAGKNEDMDMYAACSPTPEARQASGDSSASSTSSSVRRRRATIACAKAIWISSRTRERM